MKKIIISTFLLLLSISLISAVTIYSGESIILELEKPYAYYSIVGNSTEVILDIIQDGNSVIITPSKYSVNDSYEIIFFDTEKETITIYQSSGGGGGSTTTKYVDRNVTKYVDKEVIKYEDKIIEKEVPTEVIKTKTSWWIWGLIIILIVVLIYTIVRRSNYQNE